MSRWYRRDGTPVPEFSGEWGRATDAERRVALDDVVAGARKARVSTVWLGLDHSYLPDGPPLIFETMTFCDGVPELDQEGQRYSTEAEAKAGHTRAVAEARRILTNMERACG